VIQTINDMIRAGATEDEAKRATMVFELLRPGLKIMRNGTVETSWGSKSVLGLYRTILATIREGE
jgi:hypothetical protein